MTNYLTQSRMQTFRQCPRKHEYAYELGIRKDHSSTPLRFGTNFHDGLDWLAQGETLDQVVQQITWRYSEIPGWCVDDESITDWFVEAETCIRLLQGYVWRWRDDPIEIIATEQSFDLPIINPATGKESKVFRSAGKIDKIIRWDGRLAVMEHKTTSDSLDQDGDYFKRLAIDHQVSHYVISAKALGYDVETVLYDVIRKPSIRPKKLVKKDLEYLKAHGEYFGESIDYEGEESETPQLYGARLAYDILQRPDFYFCRREIPRLWDDLEDYKRELWQTQQTIRNSQRLGLWYRNTHACMNPYPCEYKHLCFNSIDPHQGVPDGFVQIENVHPELGVVHVV